MKRSPLLVIFVTVFIDLVGFGIVIPVLPFYVEGTKFNASARMVGLLFASYSVMQLIFTPILGRLSDRYGRRPVLFISLLGTALGFLIMGLAWTLPLLFLGRVIDGITGGNISTAQAYIADITTPENRAKGMGLIGAAFGLGFIFGPAIGGILSKWGIGVPLFFAAGLAFCNAVLLYFVLPETVDKEHPARVSAAEGRWSQLAHALKQQRLAFVLTIYFLFVVAFSIMTTSFALFTMYRFGFDAEHNGYVFALVGVVGAIIQGGLIGRLAKRFGEVPLTITGALLFAVSLFMIPLIGPGTGLLTFILVGAGFAIGNSLATPSLTSLASKSVGPAEQGGVLGVTQSAASLARVVGPTLSSFLIYSAVATLGADGKTHNMSDHSLFATFWTAAAIMFIAFLISLYFARSHAAEYETREVAPAS
jgi:DHA1 family tetracycline resistance protein-like MFS transporter